MDVNSYISNDIIFDAKASAVPYNYRISYKMALICAIIGKCCGKKGCSAIKLQMISAATTNSKAKDDLLGLLDNPFTSKITVVRFDPAISRAINLAMADGMIFRQSNGLYRLKDKGKSLLNAIYKDEGTLVVEKQLLAELSNRLTEDMIERIASHWRSG
ncbi:MAG: hypothetical protein IKC46_10895 [Lachnospiraceae bacterium]|nr:hypothetical protein [Lachnospiraceae bacterium]